MPDPLGSFDYTWPFYLALVLGYLLGSIPFGLLLVRLAGQGDIRNIGSGNIGATNVLRTGRKVLAAATLLLDGGKGTIVTVLGLQYGADIAILSAGGALIGHCFPVWLKFKGGKGVATGIGILLGFSLLLGVVAIMTWLLVATVFRYSSLAAMLTFMLCPLVALLIMDQQHAEFTGFMAVLIVARHFENILRLVRGQESKISFSK
jgi:acyl phosphate:glycerol-3-phosphate acyltransferase